MAGRLWFCSGAPCVRPLYGTLSASRVWTAFAVFADEPACPVPLGARGQESEEDGVGSGVSIAAAPGPPEPQEQRADDQVQAGGKHTNSVNSTAQLTYGNKQKLIQNMKSQGFRLRKRHIRHIENNLFHLLVRCPPLLERTVVFVIHLPPSLSDHPLFAALSLGAGLWALWF